MDDIKKLGAQLQAARLAAGMTRTALAQVAGVYYQTISNIEEGTTVPMPYTLSRLAKALPQAGLAAWREPVLLYHRQVRTQRRQRSTQRSLQRDPAQAPAERRPPSRPQPTLSIGEICRRAKAAGMTYGDYVDKMRRGEV